MAVERDSGNAVSYSHGVGFNEYVKFYVKLDRNRSVGCADYLTLLPDWSLNRG